MKKDFSDVFRTDCGIDDRRRLGIKNSTSLKLNNKINYFEDYDDLDIDQTKKFKFDTRLHHDKSPAHNYQLLRSFLKSRVGLYWNDIWKEICEQLDSRSYNGSVIRKQLKDLVTNYGFSHYRRRYYDDFYVDDNGILRFLKKENFYSSIEKPVTTIYWKDGLYFELIQEPVPIPCGCTVFVHFDETVPRFVDNYYDKAFKCSHGNTKKTVGRWYLVKFAESFRPCYCVRDCYHIKFNNKCYYYSYKKSLNKKELKVLNRLLT